jgi:hypothetical protein
VPPAGQGGQVQHRGDGDGVRPVEHEVADVQGGQPRLRQGPGLADQVAFLAQHLRVLAQRDQQVQAEHGPVAAARGGTQHGPALRGPAQFGQVPDGDRAVGPVGDHQDLRGAGAVRVDAHPLDDGLVLGLAGLAGRGGMAGHAGQAIPPPSSRLALETTSGLTPGRCVSAHSCAAVWVNTAQSRIEPCA